MAVVLFRNSSIIVTMQHTFRKVPGGVVYWRMRVPKGLASHHDGRRWLVKSLKTTDDREAAPRAAQLTAEHEALWNSLRSPEAQAGTITPKQTREAAKALLKALGLQPGGGRTNPDDWWRILDAWEHEHGREFIDARHDDPEDGAAMFLTPLNREVERLFKDGEGAPEITMGDARATYFRLHKEGDEARFQRDVNLPVDNFISLCGDLPLERYTRAHANTYRDEMQAKGNKSATVRRRLSVLSAVFNLAKREHSLRAENPFEGVIIARAGADATRRLPFTMDELKTILAACRVADDDMRHVLSIQLDSGARLSEVVGLRVEDVFLSDPIPHVFIRDHRALGRRVKTAVSNRKNPLVGEALWGATRAVAEARKAGSAWLFPRYATDGKIKGNHASAALNKWLKTLPGVTKTTHSFRHSMRDRMREAGIPEDLRDAIDGHGTKSVGESYGSGYSLRVLQEAMLKVVISAEHGVSNGGAG